MTQLRFLVVPIAIIAFNAAFMLIMRTILLSASKSVAPFIALLIASCILGGATYLSRTSPNPPSTSPGGDATHH
jgi:hypothetical protein